MFRYEKFCCSVSVYKVIYYTLYYTSKFFIQLIYKHKEENILHITDSYR